MMEGWTTESVLKKHGLWRPLAGPAEGPTAIKLQWQDMQIEKLREALLKYAEHLPGCELRPGSKQDGRGCTCGLTDLLWTGKEPVGRQQDKPGESNVD